MKLKHLLLAAGLLYMHDSALAQAVKQSYGCYTDEHNLEMDLKNPQNLLRSQEFERYYQQFLKQNANSKTTAANIKIPVVVHVVTEKGLNGISKAQVINGIDSVLNKDFQRLNKDTINTHPVFKTAPYKLGSNLGIEFVMARIDPNGNPTEGINRVTTDLTNGPMERDDVKRAAPSWDPTKYFNVWLVQTINSSTLSGGGTILGYAQFPDKNGVNDLPFYGLVMLHSQWGKVGNVPGSTATTDGRTATHEAGHCFNLYHTFQGGCSGPDHTQTGDRVGDTPQSAQATYLSNCNNTQDLCPSTDTGLGSVFTSNVQDMTENYMSYDECQNMFTKGQKTRALAALTGFSHLVNLTSTNNANATGINPAVTVGPLVPQPYFGVQEQRVCAGNSVNFTDASYNGTVASWNWSFPGGTPSTSTAQNPTVTYATPGKYDVILSVTNPTGGSRSKTFSNFIEVEAITNLDNVAPGKQFVEDFEDTNWPTPTTASLKWDRLTNSVIAGTANWEQTTLAATTGTKSIRLRNASARNGSVSTLISPTINIAGIPGPNNLFYAFDMAFASKVGVVPAEKLEIFASNDCGQTWRSLFTKTGAALVTPNSANIAGSSYFPSATQWRTEIDNITPNLLGGTLTFKIEATSREGHHLYIDNFRLYTILGTNEDVAMSNNIKVYPNPVTAETGISFDLKTAQKVTVKVFDLVGNTIYAGKETSMAPGSHTIGLFDKMQNLSAGMYMVQLQIGEKVFNTKLIAQ